MSEACQRFFVQEYTRWRLERKRNVAARTYTFRVSERAVAATHDCCSRER